MKKNRVFHVFSDSGHSWVRVTYQLLQQLNIHNKISQYSYVKGKFVYLEEDYDAGILLHTLKSIGVKYKFNYHYSDISRIRYYVHYDGIE